MEVGAIFNSENEFVTELKKWEDETKSMYYKRSTTNLKTARKKGVHRYINPTLPYQILFCCIHGGKKVQKQTIDNTRNTRTFQKNCPANIRLIVSEDGNHLTITNTNFDHNHETTEALYKHLPHKRKLNRDEMYKVEEFLKAGGNKKKIKHIMECETKKMILLKDLRNLEYNRKCKDNSLNAVVDLLQQTYCADCEILVENNVFKGIFFQTEPMISSMKSYPEFIAVDATYKLLNIRTPVYIILCENSNGLSEIVAVAILVSEDKKSMEWFLNTFKEKNPSWINNRVVMSDKDLLERQVLKESFPNSSVIICIFHSLKTFNREITCEKMGITPGQRDTAKEIFQKMLYSQSEEEYDDLYSKIVELPQRVIEYFNSNWHSIRDDWTLNHNFLENSLNNTTNNRLESINQKLKSVIAKDSSLIDFIENFFLLHHGMLEERDQVAAYEYFKIPLQRFQADSPQLLYSKMLTNYAYNYVHKELEQYKKIKIISEENKSYYTIQTETRTIKVSVDSCTCRVRISLVIPCRHIFAVREKEKLCLFEPSLCNTRWTLSHVRKHQRVFKDCSLQPLETQHRESTIITDIAYAEKATQRKLNKFEKYKKSMLVLRDIASLISEQSGDNFDLSMQSILKLKDLFLDGKLVEVSELYENVSDSAVKISQDKNYFEHLDQNRDLESHNSSYEITEEIVTVENGEIIEPIETETYYDKTAEVDREGNINFPQKELVYSTEISCLSLLNVENKIETVVFESKDNQAVESEKLSHIVLSDHNYSRKANNTSSLKNSLDQIIIPKVAKIRGRPKGSSKTVIGLPKVGLTLKKKPFVNRTTSEKKIFILKLVSPSSLKEVYAKKKTIEIEDLNSDLPYSLLHENINLNLIREFCSEASWHKIATILSDMKNIPCSCVQCNCTLDDMSIICASCLKSYHLFCVALKQAPKKRNWMCRYC